MTHLQATIALTNVRHTDASAASTAQQPASPEAPPLLPPSKCDELAVSGDAGEEIAAILLKAAKAMAKSAREEKQTLMQVQAHAEESKLDHMKDAANDRFVGGLAGGIAGVASGVSTAGGGFASGGGADVAKGMAIFNKGSGEGVSAFFSRSAADADIAAQQDERVIGAAKRQVESSADDEKDAKELTSKVLDFYKEYTAGVNDAKKAAILRA